MVPVANIVRGQAVSEGMRDRARQLRRAMTPAEERLWAELRNNRLDGFHFRRQQVIDGYITDFYCHAAALAVETDGSVHDRQPGYDA
jgi:very-short-patch-repair endonuclease